MKKVLIVGTGFVADLYMRSFALYPDIEIAGAFDTDRQRLDAFCAYWKAPAKESLDALFKAGGAGALVLNLTNPRAHFDVTKAALEAGFDVYSEKPLAMTIDDAIALRDLAHAKSLILASAPCSVLGESAQLMIAALKAGKIGAPQLVYAELDDDYILQAPYQKWFSESGAPWPHKDEFEVGCTLEHAGYYLTWLMAAFGSIETVVAASAALIPDKPGAGAATAPDFSVAVLTFKSGVVARLTCSILAPHDHRLKIIGPGGVLSIHDCWRNDAPVHIRRRKVVRRRLINNPFAERIRPVGATHAKVGRKGAAAMNFALGPVEVMAARVEGRPSRLDADFALHLTEATLAIQNAGMRSAAYKMTTTCAAVAPQPWAVLKGA